MRFLFKTTVFYWVVWGLSKTFTTYGSVYFPRLINNWYDLNNQLIRDVPFFGDNLRALMRDNIADGTMAFWEVWIVLGLLIGLVDWITKEND